MSKEKNIGPNLNPSIVKDKISILETLKKNITSIMNIDSQTGFNKTINLLEEFIKWLTPFQNMEMKGTLEDENKRNDFMNQLEEKLEINFNLNDKIVKLVNECRKNMDRIKFWPDENFKESKYIKVINEIQNLNLLNVYINNMDKSREENLDCFFYLESTENSNKEINNKENSIKKMNDNINFTLNDEKQKLIDSFSNSLKLLIFKVNNMLLESKKAIFPTIKDTEDPKQIIEYFQKIFDFNKDSSDTLNLNQIIDKRLKSKIIDKLETDFSIFEENGESSSDTSKEAYFSGKESSSSGSEPEDIFPTKKNQKKFNEKLFYFINIITPENEYLSTEELKKIYNKITKKLSFQKNYLLLLKNFSIDNIIKSEHFEKLTLKLINEYPIFSKFYEIKLLKNNLLIEKYKIDQKYFDNRGNFLVPNSRNNIFRGKELYDPPYGWIGIGLKVLGKYKDGNNWLEDISNNSEWAIAYRGIGYNKDNKSGKIFNFLKYFILKDFNIVINSFQSKLNDIRHGGEVKDGIYLTPYINIAEKYTDCISFNNQKYKVLLMAKVKIDKIREPEGSNFWVLNNEDIRIYRVLLKKIS